ncbi:MAG: hypothetical protein ABSC72_08305 [Methylovirgula sp.]
MRFYGGIPAEAGYAIMIAKVEIVEQLGEKALLLPDLLAEALSANDRLKLRLSLLQEALAHGRHPQAEARSFEAERHAVGLADPNFDRIISGAQLTAGNLLAAPGASALIKGIAADLALMLAPLKAANPNTASAFEARLSALIASLPSAANDTLDTHAIDAMTSARQEEGDSVHRLVMGMHKAVNQLAAETAVETIDGARAHHVTDDDRARIKAFMAGLNRTAPLAFGHPGLGTTAVRVGQRLTIQNDIGTTDAHVLVIHVENKSVRVTYTDVHWQRAKFFISLFAGQNVTWSPMAEESTTGAGEKNAFYLVNGTYDAPETAALMRFLDFLGSRIVFLIDWNKARKALQTFIGKDAAIACLTWAAAHDYGHRAFLELGGPNLLFEAIRRTASGRIPYGARLDETLGESDCAKFLRLVLRETSEGLQAGRSTRLIRDQIQADLGQRFETAQASVLAILLLHLGITRMLSTEIAEALRENEATADRASLAQDSKRMEEKADRLTLEAREICARVQNSSLIMRLVDSIENSTDMLDEGAFLLSLLPTGNHSASVTALADLAEIVIESIGNLTRAVAAASCLPQGRQTDAADALQAIDLVLSAERRADAAERTAFSAFATPTQSDPRALMLGFEVARALETATDHLAHAALSLRDLVLEDLSA